MVCRFSYIVACFPFSMFVENYIHGKGCDEGSLHIAKQLIPNNLEISIKGCEAFWKETSPSVLTYGLV